MPHDCDAIRPPQASSRGSAVKESRPQAPSPKPHAPEPTPNDPSSEFSFDQANSTFASNPESAASNGAPDVAVAIAPDSRSSIFDKLDPVHRRKLDQAIIDRTPRSLRETYDKYQLKSKGVSYTAFYYYARRIRTSNDLLEHARLMRTDGRPIEEHLRDILLQRLLELSLDDKLLPRAIERLANAYRMAAQIHLNREKFRRESPLRGKYRDEGPAAPYGYRPDGTPHTREEFITDLGRAVRDIYGLDLDVHEIARTSTPGYRYRKPESPANGAQEKPSLAQPLQEPGASFDAVVSPLPDSPGKKEDDP